MVVDTPNRRRIIDGREAYRERCGVGRHRCRRVVRERPEVRGGCADASGTLFRRVAAMPCPEGCPSIANGGIGTVS